MAANERYLTEGYASGRFVLAKSLNQTDVTLSDKVWRCGTTNKGDFSGQTECPTAYGVYLSLQYATNRNQGFQIYGDTSGLNQGIYYRARFAGDGNTSYNNWRRVLDEANYSSYALPLTAGSSYPLTGRLHLKAAAIEYDNADGTFRGMLDITAAHVLQMYDNTNWNTIYHSGNFVAGTNYQAPISDLATIRSNASNGNTAYNSLGNYLPLAGGNTTGPIWRKMNADTSNAETAIGWKKKGDDTIIAYIGYYNVPQKIFINAIGADAFYTDAVGKYSLVIGNNHLTYNTYSILHTGNFTAGTNYQAPISDIATIRSNASNGNTAYNSLGNYLPLSGGVVTTGGQITTAGSTNGVYGGGIQVRESNYAGSSATDAVENAPGITFHWASVNVFKLWMSRGGSLNWGGNTVWHSGNDGAGSGLDADTLDGYNSNQLTSIYAGGFCAGNGSFYAKVAEYTSASAGTVDFTATFLVTDYATGGVPSGNILVVRCRSNTPTSTPSINASWALENSTMDIYVRYQISGNYLYVRIYTYSSGWGRTLNVKLLNCHAWSSAYEITKWKMYSSTYTGSSITTYTSLPTAETNVTIGTNAIITGNITANGTITSTGDQVISSDATLKTNLTDVDYSVEDIANAPAVTFDWKDGRGHSFGSIAQYWENVIPESVHGNEGKKSLSYAQLALVNSVLLARENMKLRERIDDLEKLIKEKIS